MSQTSYPFHIQLHLTNKCNLQCKHCYEGIKTQACEWNYSELITLISQIETTFQKWNVEGEISLVGGEPMMYPHLSELLYHLNESPAITRVAILTNGTFIPEDVFKAILDTRPTVQISIDGIDEQSHDFIRGKGNYSKSISHIKKLVSHNIPVFIHYVISKYTVPIPKSFIDYLNDLGVKQITFSRDVPIGSSDTSFLLSNDELREIYNTLFEYKKKYGTDEIVINTARPLWACFGESGRCPVGFQTLTILHDGTVFPCRRLPIPIGNVKNETLFSIWYNSKVLWDIRNRSNLNKCGTCKHLDDCGGARCIAYAVTGNYMEADPQCWI